MNPLTQARTTAAEALRDLGVPVHGFLPATVQPPCVVILPRYPWMQPGGTVGLTVRAYANTAGGNEAALLRLEQLATDTAAALWAAGLAAQDVSAPDTTEQAWTVEIALSLRVRC
jgi:hypothetical protein